MFENKRRFFIELSLTDPDDIPRRKEAMLRRAKAEQFVTDVGLWLQEEDLDNKVANMAITALGHVQITCAEDVIERLQSVEDHRIAQVRASMGLTESLRHLGCSYS